MINHELRITSDLFLCCGCVFSCLFLSSFIPQPIPLFLCHSAGQQWYSFGWESQLLETGLLGVWGVPLLSLRRLPAGSPPPDLLVWGLRWLLFRIMLGAGLIKVRGDPCWMDLTCMNYHYQVGELKGTICFYF